MNDVRARLARCFAAAFPNATARDIPTLEQARTEAWDSLASATLFALLQEEFGIELDWAELERLDSFSRIESYLNIYARSSTRIHGE